MTKSFWATLADYTSELAPVAGPLLAAVSDTAAAVDRAGSSTRSLRASNQRLDAQLLAPIDITTVPAPRPRARTRKTKPRTP